MTLFKAVVENKNNDVTKMSSKVNLGTNPLMVQELRDKVVTN